MATIDDLEAALRTDLDRATVEVYGDVLQSDGDLRGELIAIDLRIADTGITPALRVRRDELVKQWLGATIPNGRVRFGFVDVDATSADPAAQLRVAFDGPAAPYVRTVAIVGPPKLVAEALAIVAARPCRALVNVVVRQWAEHATPAVTAAAGRRFVDGIPHLRTLELDGRNVFGELAHGNLRALRLSGFDAIASAPARGLAFPALERLDLALHCHLAAKHEDPPAGWAARLLQPSLVPALIELELSRNEPGYLDPKNLGGTTNVFAVLRELPILAQLQRLALPALANEIDVRHVQSALAGMPALQELTMPRTGFATQLAHPRATITVT